MGERRDQGVRDFSEALGVLRRMEPALFVRLATTALPAWCAMADGTVAPPGGARTGRDAVTVVPDVDATIDLASEGAAVRFASGLDGLPLDRKLERLVAEHGEAVYRVARSVVGDPVAAEDVAQEALLKAWQALPTYRGEAPLRSWLLRITHNTAVSALRRRREEPHDPMLLPEAAPGDSTERTIERRASVAAFERALGELDDLSRSIVVLRELEGLSYEDIASLLAVPLPTVKTRLLRARRLLSVSLEGWRP